MKRSFSIGILLGLFVFAEASASAQNCVPNANQIAVFENDNFQGRCKVLNIGDFPSPQQMGFDSDSITSFKVGANVQVDVCEDDNYQGACQTYGEDAVTLVGTNIGNDSISSLKVYRKNAPAVTKPPPPADTKPGNQKKMDVFGALEFAGVIDKLRGNWLETSAHDYARRFVFTNAGEQPFNAGELVIVDPESDFPYSRYIYLVKDAQTIEFVETRFEVVTAKMTFQGDRLTLAWQGNPRPAVELKIESETPSPNPGTGCLARCLPVGNWVGIPGTNTAGERISVVPEGYFSARWLSSQNKGEWKSNNFTDMMNPYEDGSNLPVYVNRMRLSGDEVTIVKKGVEKTYRRLKLPKK